MLVGGGVSLIFMYVLCAWGLGDVSMYIPLVQPSAQDKLHIQIQIRKDAAK